MLSVSELAFGVCNMVSQLLVPLICLVYAPLEVLDVITLVVWPKERAQPMPS